MMWYWKKRSQSEVDMKKKAKKLTNWGNQKGLPWFEEKKKTYMNINVVRLRPLDHNNVSIYNQNDLLQQQNENNSLYCT